MPRKKRRKRQTPDHLHRDVIISEARTWLSFAAEQKKGEEPQFDSTTSIELKGVLDQPIRDVRDVEIVVYPSDDPRPGKDPSP